MGWLSVLEEEEEEDEERNEFVDCCMKMVK